MPVKEIIPNILCFEYREDKDYGTCLWARFMFNLDRYEMTITSECGIYGYKWRETPDSESFLELMAKCDKEYILNKIYGKADIFDYDATKEHIYECCCHDDEDKAILDRIFENIEWDYEPNEVIDFMRKFDEENDGYFSGTWEFPQYKYPADAIKIVSVFDECIRPKIKEKLEMNEGR